MEIRNLTDNAHASIRVLPEQDLIRLTWKGVVNGKVYREQLEHLLRMIKAEEVKLLLIDARKLGPVFFADQAWTNNEFMDQILDAGIMRHAMLGSRDGMSLIVGDKLLKASNGDGDLEVVHFDNLSMAMLWLLNNAEVDVSNYMERERIETLHSYRILDTAAQRSYDDITRIASYVAEAPIALISLVDSERQWFKSKVGLDASETSRQVSFCSHAIKTPEVTFIVQDASKDERFANNTLVNGHPNIRYYAGAPLVSAEGAAIGTLCVIDTKPRELDEQQLETLRALARLVVMQLEYRRLAFELQSSQDDLELYMGHLKGNKKHLERIMDRQLAFITGGPLVDNRNGVDQQTDNSSSVGAEDALLFTGK